MSDLALFYQQLHGVVYDLTGWALPDDGLRLLAEQMPTRLHREAEEGGWNRRLRHWCAIHPEAVEMVIQNLQSFA